MTNAAEALPQEASAGQKLRPLRVLICVPTHGEWKSGFGWSLARAMTHFATMHYDGEKAVELEVIRSSTLPETRTRLVSRAYKYDATHILWLDCDMKFPKDVIPRLLNHNKAVVGINYVTKEANPRAVAYKETGDYIGPVWTRDDSTGLEQVTLLGMGVMLTDIGVFDRIGDFPHFMFEPQPPQKIKQSGEDAYFCSKLRDAGIDVFIDHDLSKQCAHIGDFEYTCRMAELAQEVKMSEYDALPGGVPKMGEASA